jgi:hypothetical protein
VQSLILASILLVSGFTTILAAFLADLLAANRRLLEDQRFRLRSTNVTLEQDTQFHSGVRD